MVRWIYGERWIPALPVFYVFVATMGAAFIAPLATSALEAAGQPRLTAAMSLAWTLLNWAVVGGAMWFTQSVLAFAVAYSVHVFVGNGVALYVLRRQVPGLDVARVLLTGVLAAAASAGLGRLVMPANPGAWSILGAGCAVAALFVGLTFAANRRVYREWIATSGLRRWLNA